MKRKSALALTLGLSLAVGSLTGTYTMAQANQKPAEIHILQTGPDKMHGPENYGHEGPMHDRQNHQELLTLLQIDEQTFKQEAESGKSLMEIGAAHNIPRQDIIDFIAKNINKQIDNRLAQSITVEQANEMKTHAVEQAQQRADVKPMMGADRRHGPGQRGPIPQAMLTLLQIDEQTFKQEADSGKSLAEIGATHNVSRQDIVDVVAKDMNDNIDRGLAEKRITAEQADEMKTNSVERAQQIVDGKMMEHPPQP